MAQPKNVLEKMCPLLTIGVMRPPSALLGADGQRKSIEYEAVPCAGPACAWFMNTVNEQGQVTGGDCAIALGCAANGNLVNLGMVGMAVLEQKGLLPQQSAAPSAIPPAAPAAKT